MSKSVQAKLIGHFRRRHGVGQILLVGKDQEDGITKLFFVEHSVQLISGSIDSISVVGIDDEDDAVRVLVVMSPERSDLVLPTNVPDSEGNVLVLDAFHVEADGGDGSDDFAELQLVKDGGFAGGVQTDHQDSHLARSEHSSPESGERQAHGLLEKA
jgi:hypothetical protein